MTELDLTSHWTGLLSLAIFVIAYVLVIFEEATEMRKSKPVMVAAGLIWALIGLAFTLAGDPESALELQVILSAAGFEALHVHGPVHGARLL